MSRIVHKKDLVEDVDRTLKKDSGVFWQDLDSTERTVKKKDLKPARFSAPGAIFDKDGFEIVRLTGDETPLQAFAPTPRIVLGALTKGAVQISKKAAGGIKTAPKTQVKPVPVPPETRKRTKKQRKGEVRVYVADDVDIFVENLYNGFLSQIEAATLAQPKHAKRRRRKVASRN